MRIAVRAEEFAPSITFLSFPFRYGDTNLKERLQRSVCSYENKDPHIERVAELDYLLLFN